MNDSELTAIRCTDEHLTGCAYEQNENNPCTCEAWKIHAALRHIDALTEELCDFKAMTTCSSCGGMFDDITPPQDGDDAICTTCAYFENELREARAELAEDKL